MTTQTTAAEPAVAAAQIAAQATIRAAEIAAQAGWINAAIGALGTGIALIGTVLVAYVAYRNVQAPLERSAQHEENKNRVLLAEIHVSVQDAIRRVDDALDEYKEDFGWPKRIHVLPEPSVLLDVERKKAFSSLNPEINAQITLVRGRLEEYRRAKDPVEKHYRGQDAKGAAKEPAYATGPVDGWDRVKSSAEQYRADLLQLEKLTNLSRK